LRRNERLRCRLAEAHVERLELMSSFRHLLADRKTDFRGRFYWAEGLLDRYRRPQFRSTRLTSAALSFASKLGCGLMLEPTTPFVRLPEIAKTIGDLAPVSPSAPTSTNARQISSCSHVKSLPGPR